MQNTIGFCGGNEIGACPLRVCATAQSPVTAGSLCCLRALCWPWPAQESLQAAASRSLWHVVLLPSACSHPLICPYLASMRKEPCSEAGGEVKISICRKTQVKKEGIKSEKKVEEKGRRIQVRAEKVPQRLRASSAIAVTQQGLMEPSAAGCWTVRESGW